MPSAFFTAPVGIDVPAGGAGRTTEPSALTLIGFTCGCCWKPLAGGVGNWIAPDVVFTLPVGACQLAGGVTPEGIWVPGITTEPLGNTVVPCGKEAEENCVPAGKVTPDGTVTPVGNCTLLGTCTPGGSLVPVGITQLSGITTPAGKVILAGKFTLEGISNCSGKETFEGKDVPLGGVKFDGKVTPPAFFPLTTGAKVLPSGKRIAPLVSMLTAGLVGSAIRPCCWVSGKKGRKEPAPLTFIEPSLLNCTKLAGKTPASTMPCTKVWFDSGGTVTPVGKDKLEGTTKPAGGLKSAGKVLPDRTCKLLGSCGYCPGFFTTGTNCRLPHTNEPSACMVG